MLFPVEQLLKGKDELVKISGQTSVREALQIMFTNDFSQLPVVDGNGNLVGLVTEQTIISTYFHTQGKVSLLDFSVDNCVTQPITVSKDRDIFEALDRLKTYYAVLITENDKPIGILTAYDTTNFFRDLTEGLIFLEDIEVTLRQYIEEAFQTSHAIDAALVRAFGQNKKNLSRPAKEYEKLDFGDHIRLITTEDNWEKFVRYFSPQDLFANLMDQARQVRNQLAHFRGRLDPVQRGALIRARDWLASRPKPSSLEKQHVKKVDEREIKSAKAASGGGKYDSIQNWLEKQKEAGENRLRVSFQDIERILGDILPDSARSHRSWWANDLNSHTQSSAWMTAGWLVESVDLNAQEVFFRTSPAALYPSFFGDLLDRLKAIRPGITQATRTSTSNWFSFSAGRSGFSFAWVLPKDPILRVELYIDTGNEVESKKFFDALQKEKSTIEQEIGSSLTWQRLDKNRASRVYKSNPFRITNPLEEHEPAKQWGLETMLKFIDTFGPRIKAL
jgi:CBS domain-containing protein